MKLTRPQHLKTTGRRFPRLALKRKKRKPAPAVPARSDADLASILTTTVHDAAAAKAAREHDEQRRHPIAAARRLAESRTPTSEPGMCLREVRKCYDVGPAATDAIGAWNAAEKRHRVNPGDLDTIPAGVPIYWAGGSSGHGHVAISTVKRGHCWSMDIRRPGYFDRVPIDEITREWGLTFLGWTEDLNGVTVYTPKGKK